MMWRSLIALIGLSITGVDAFAENHFSAESPPQAAGLASDRPGSQIPELQIPELQIDEPKMAEPTAGYLSRSGVVRFQLVQGRLCLDAPRHRKGAQSCEAAGIYESVSVTAKRGIPSVHYVFQSKQRHVTLSVQDACQVRLESWLPRTSQRCILIQPASGKIRLETKSDRGNQQWTASTLIHLHHLQPELLDLHFGSLFVRMLRGESLRQISEQTRQAAMREMLQPARSTKQQILKCVADLGSAKRSVRAGAARQLSQQGTTIVSTVEDLLEKDLNLDAEQTARLKRILKNLNTPVPDRPRSLAKLLIYDQEYWSVVASELTRDQRYVVSRRLIDFGVSVNWNDREMSKIRIAGN